MCDIGLSVAAISPLSHPHPRILPKTSIVYNDRQQMLITIANPDFNPNRNTIEYVHLEVQLFIT